MRKYLLTRETGKWTDILPIAAILSIQFPLFTTLPANILFRILHIPDFFLFLAGGDEAASAFLREYAIFIGIWILFFLNVLIFKNNRPMLKALKYRRETNNLKGALIGLLMGFGSNAICILMSWLMGDIKLTFNGFHPALFIAFLIAVCIQSGGEELTDRCYLYQKLRRGYKNPWIAILANACVFSALHLLNPGVTILSVLDIFLSGLVFSLFVYYYDCFWAAVMMHAGWNFTQSILFGLPNSGVVSAYSVFKLDAASARDGLFYTVNFGVEGSLGSILILAVIAAVMIYLNRGKMEKADFWA
ncbi:MAG: CPBP family intramembrane metalloprotease [Lachnospiraceae bacterium]|nr:CPBP family intramembrane metalloprotease [Lachnospiraceae bacterium]